MIDIVTASHDKFTLGGNLLASPMFSPYESEQAYLSVLTGYNNISIAYNYCRFENTLVAYIHHDVWLPEDFTANLLVSIEMIERMDNNWGVLGVAGVKLINGKKENHGYIMDRGKEWGSPDNLPAEVDTLDEMLLITKGDFVFDENLDLDFYGADICMQAKAQGRKNYAINAFCHHNSTRPFGGRTESFYRCQEYFKNKWKGHGTIATTCAIIET